MYESGPKPKIKLKLSNKQGLSTTHSGFLLLKVARTQSAVQFFPMHRYLSIFGHKILNPNFYTYSMHSDVIYHSNPYA